MYNYNLIDTSNTLIELRQNGDSIAILGDGHLSEKAHNSIAKLIFKVIENHKINNENNHLPN